MKKTLIVIGLALLIFVFFLLAIAPAKVATRMITDMVPGLVLNNVEGSLWSIEAKSVQYKQFKLNNINLSSNPFALLVGQLSSELTVNDPALTVDSNVKLSQSEYQLTDTHYELDAAFITDNVRVPIEGLKGRINGTIQKAHLTQKELLALQGSGQWRGAVIEYPNNNLELGDIRYALSKVAEQNKARVDIVENQGPLDLKGFIELSMDKSFRMDVHTTTDLPANLKNWLSVWGRQQNNRIHIQWQGRLP